MKNIKVESSKNYYHGFVLNEQELRRIVQTCEEQFVKIKSDGQCFSKYEVRFENGVVAETISLDSIFNLENSGNGTITRIEIISQLAENDDSCLIKLIFRNVDSNSENGLISINHSITGLSRDWVFITSSLLQERIQKIKRWVPNQLGESRSPYSRILAMSIIMFLFITMFFPILINENDKNETEKKVYLQQITQLDSLTKNGVILNPMDLILRIEKTKIQNDINKIGEESIFSKIKARNLIGPGVLILLIFFYMFMVKYYPAYCFCWGDYQEIFNRKESIRKTVFVVIIIGIVVSTLGGIIANNLWK